MDEYEAEPCDMCGETLREHDGEWFCPHCDSVSGFELVPDTEDFKL